MQLSPLYQLLIYIEDKKEASHEDLKFVSPAVLRGILGKMEAMKLVEKEPDGKIKISQKGQDLLNTTLDFLHEKTIHWDGKWRLISFSIPEINRSLRDKFRRYLDSLGVKMIFSGLWISPLNINSVVATYAKHINVYKNVILIESSQILTGITQEDLQSLWEFEETKPKIYEFIERASEFNKIKKHSSFEIKKLIFEYATILQSQPKVPIELFPKDWPQFRANILYKQIRRRLS